LPLDVDIDREKGVWSTRSISRATAGEYDYKIDALIGDILEWDKERD
jgi:hypothetical protein